MNPKNWLGLDSHPTDEFFDYLSTISDMQEARESYNRIATAGFVKELKALMYVAYDAGSRQALL